MSYPLVFIHMPKTAGTTLDDLLYSVFGPVHTSPPYFTDMTLLTERPYKYIRGHLRFAPTRALFPTGTYVTILRDPIARLVSHYRSFHKPENLTPEWREALTAEQIAGLEFCHTASFADFLRSDRKIIIDNTFNPYVAVLADDGAQNPLRSAKDNLERFAFVGIQEMWRTSLAMLFDKIGAAMPAKAFGAALNKSPSYEAEIDAETLPLIYERVGLDLELYRWAQERFDAAAQEYAKQKPVETMCACGADCRSLAEPPVGVICRHRALGGGYRMSA
jgi:hypothetical protein